MRNMHKVIVKQAAIYRASNTIRWFARLSDLRGSQSKNKIQPVNSTDQGTRGLMGPIMGKLVREIARSVGFYPLA